MDIKTAEKILPGLGWFKLKDIHPNIRSVSTLIRRGNGVRARVFFNNGWGASIISSPYSLGGLENLFELAVLKGTEDAAEINYETAITKDVLGWQSETDILAELDHIKALPDA